VIAGEIEGIKNFLRTKIWRNGECAITFATVLYHNTYQERQRVMALRSLGNPYSLLNCKKVPTPSLMVNGER
jgi:hypothetical protein